MIRQTLLLGLPFLAIMWAIGLATMKDNGPALAIWSTRFATVISLIGMVSPLVLPRYSEWLFGELGHGDGFGLIGLIMIGAIGLLMSLLAMLLTIALHGRFDANKEKGSE